MLQMNGRSPASFVSEVNSGHRESRRVVMVTAVGVWAESRVTLQSKQFKINQKSSADLRRHGYIKHLCSPKRHFFPPCLCHLKVQIGFTGSAGGSGWAENMGGAKSFRSFSDNTMLPRGVLCTGGVHAAVHGRRAWSGRFRFD